MPGSTSPTGTQPLIEQVRTGRTVRTRHMTMLSGWLKALQTANRQGTQNPAVNQFISEQTPLIERYCEAMENTAEPKTSAGGA